MKLFSFILMAAIVASPVMAKGKKRQKRQELTRVQSTMKLLNEQLPAGNYKGLTNDDYDCEFKVETSKTKTGQVDDYKVEATLHYDTEKEKDSFNLFDDGRDFSDSYVVEVTSQKNSKEGTYTYVRILEESIDDDGDTSELKAPRLSIDRDSKGTLVGVQLNKIECNIQ